MSKIAELPDAKAGNGIRIPLASILIEPAEGPHVGRKWTVSNWSDADARLRAIALSARSDLGYHKVDCTMSFEDGWAFTYTYHVCGTGQTGLGLNPLQASVRFVQLCWACDPNGRPSGFGDAAWKKYVDAVWADSELSRLADRAKMVLTRYDLGQ
ncbi:hypothetical protein [Rhodanobacter sp. FW106-PBR-R2A-1-13]|uniref:hypothetical protein n=1 Tax=Rhodanobacter sp. FW106-PBR-R2A-1-13 TaxID=3454845 RepID=UPI0034E46179